MKCSVYRISIGSPDDLTGLERLVQEGEIVPEDVIAVIGKTEGNGCVNDFTRGYAVNALSRFFAGHIGEEAVSRISFVMSGGTEGIISPHLTVISRKKLEQNALYENFHSTVAVEKQKSLAVGVAGTGTILPEYLGRMEQVRMVAQAVREAMADAGLDDPVDVHFVQVKCPLLTAVRVEDARRRNQTVITEDTYKSMGHSRGASALGVALALGEINEREVNNKDICNSWQFFSSVASTSAGGELTDCEIIVFGNSPKASGDLYIAHDVMKDAIDAQAVRRALAKAGWTAVCGTMLNDSLERPDRTDLTVTSAEVVQVLAKAEADPAGFVRGRRHTMLDDSDINHTRHARAVVGGVIASVVGDPMIYISGGAEHQGPPGGGPIAVIVRRNTLDKKEMW